MKQAGGTGGLSAQARKRKWGHLPTGCFCTYPPKLPRGSQGRGWVRVRGAWPLPPALYRRDHDFTLRVCLSSDKRTPLGPRTPAHLEFDFHNLILEGKRAGSHVPAPALGEAASDGRSGKPRGYARVSVSVCARLIKTLAAAPTDPPHRRRLCRPAVRGCSQRLANT